MPEGHSLRRLALTFQEWFVGSKCHTSSPQGRFEQGAALLDGRIMTDAYSVGKHLFLRFDADSDDVPFWLHVHLGLYGAWRFHAADGVGIAESIGAPRVASNPHTRHGDTDAATFVAASADNPADNAQEDDDFSWQPPLPRGAVRLRIDNGQVAADLNGPNQCEVLDDGEVDTVLDRLGPDPLGPNAREKSQAEEFANRVRSSRRAVGELVMDQSVIAGVGNIYRAEGLFRQGISPMRKGANVSRQRLLRLWDDYVDLLEDGVRTGKIRTVREGDLPDAESPEMQVALEQDPEALKWYAYHRAGRPCLVCGKPISEKTVQGRRLFWCSNCQR